MSFQYKTLKLLSIFLPALCLSDAVRSPLNVVERRVDTLDNITQYNAQDTLQARVAHHGAESGFSVSGSFLYWKAFEDNLEYGNLLSLGSSPIINTKNKDLSYKWGQGGQMALGYIFGDREQWQLAAEYTFFGPPKSKGSNSSNLPDQFRPNWAQGSTGLFSTSSSASWKLNFNTLDLDLGRDFFISQWISINPFFGLRGAWIYQNYKAKYLGNYTAQRDGNLGSLTFNRENSVKMRTSFEGLGIKFGSDFLFHLDRAFSLFGSLGGSAIFGYVNTKTITDVSYLTSDVDETTVILAPLQGRGKENMQRIRTSLETQIGFEWETFWNDECNRFALSATYAFNVWFDQNHFMNSYFTALAEEDFEGWRVDANPARTEIVGGNLQLQGLTLKAQFDF
jgi:hypothetical protein